MIKWTLTLKCGCRKKGQHCSEGCSCINCNNYISTAHEQATDTELAEVAVQEVATGEIQSLMDSDLDELLDWVFDDSLANSERDLQLEITEP